ncbi:OFA family MFS transporter [Deefgea tanakiae]|uniref:OFA family MFS transporter n=2 Tax=Deefgea tanakiae TaxID=2865840 RepID=A0ABX8Z5W6_9NEIS|nr:OFA family MFS transporter [Deefgea tanakiae]
MMAKNRWLMAAAGVGIHISIGSVYAWSVFSKPLMAQMGWSLKEVGFTFGLAIFMLGMSAAVMGHVVEKRGPRFSGTISAVCWSLGLLGSGFAISIGNLWMLYLCYGVLGGVGLGTGYVTPVSTLMKWFPDRRGLATGLAIMGFGFASFFGAPLMAELIQTVGIANTFYTLGVIYAVVMLSSARYLEPPPVGWKPAGMEESLASGTAKVAMDLMPMTANEAVKTKPFYGLWIMMFINITCGIAVISVASPMTQEVTGMSPLAAGAVVGLIGLFNGGGRLVWATLSDYLGRPSTYITFFTIEVVAFYFLPSMRDALVFQAVLYLIMTCYGGGFSTLPAYIGDLFGTKQVSAIHGYVLTAWAMAGLVGSSFASFLREASGSYAAMTVVFSGIFLFALAVSIAMKIFVDRELAKKRSGVSDVAFGTAQ